MSACISRPTSPKELRKAGYRTGMAGKWHLTSGADGDHVNLKASDAFGFDYVALRDEGTQNEGEKWVDHLADSAIEFIREGRDKPWFFYLAHHTQHGVVSAPPELVKKHREAGAPEMGMFNATYLAAIEHLDTNYNTNTTGQLTIKTQEFDKAPLRARKGSPYEGGIRVPRLVRWLGSVKAGQVCSIPVHLTDWMPAPL